MIKRKLSKIFSIILIIAIGVTGYLYPNWYMTQYNKGLGMFWVWRGDRALRKLKIQKAIELYQRGLALYPKHYSAWFNLGNIYVLYEDYFSAVDAYENAINANPNYVIARMNYGIISAEQLGDFDGAIDQYKTILGIRRKLVYIPYVFNNLKSYKTNIGLAYYNMGVAYRQKYIYQEGKKDYEYTFLKDAIAAYNEAIKILKNNYDAHYNLGLAYHLYGDYRNAGLYYCKAIELAPFNYEAHYNLALLLRYLKYYDESVVEMQKAVTLITEKEGSTNRQRYVFDVLNDISRRFMEMKASESPLVDRVSDSKTPIDVAASSVTYVNGHLVMSDDFDRAILENYKTCGSYKLFAKSEEDDEKDRVDYEHYGKVH